MGYLTDLAQAVIDDLDQERHRCWRIHYRDREPVEVIFAPGIKRKTVMFVYPKAVSAEPITDTSK
jgi:hypothetical protein